MRNENFNSKVLILDLQQWLRVILEQNGVLLTWPRTCAAIIGVDGEGLMQTGPQRCAANTVQNLGRLATITEFLGDTSTSSIDPAVMRRVTTSTAALAISHWIFGLTEPALECTKLTNDGVFYSVKIQKIFDRAASPADRYRIVTARELRKDYFCRPQPPGTNVFALARRTRSPINPTLIALMKNQKVARLTTCVFLVSSLARSTKVLVSFARCSTQALKAVRSQAALLCVLFTPYLRLQVVVPLAQLDLPRHCTCPI